MYSPRTGQARLALRPSTKSIRRMIETIHELTIRSEADGRELHRPLSLPAAGGRLSQVRTRDSTSAGPSATQCEPVDPSAVGGTRFVGDSPLERVGRELLRRLESNSFGWPTPKAAHSQPRRSRPPTYPPAPQAARRVCPFGQDARTGRTGKHTAQVYS